MAREQECKVLNCSTQEGAVNPPSRNPLAAAWFAWSILADTICWRPQVCSWSLKVFWKRRRRTNTTVSSEFGRVDVFLRFRCSSWMDGTRCILADTFCWLSRRPHVCSWNFKVFWKRHSRKNTTVSSEFGVDVFLRFRCSSWVTGTRCIWPTICSYFATEMTTYTVSLQQH